MSAAAAPGSIVIYRDRQWVVLPSQNIVGYFEDRTTNGIVEGINNKLKLLKRCGFGFRNFSNARIKSFTLLAFS